MAYSFGRQFRRIAAEALTADREEMRALIARILPARTDGAASVLRLTSDEDYRRAPAAIVAAFFDDVLTGDEAADLLRKTENPGFRKQVLQHPQDAYAMWGPISLDPDWRNAAGLPRSDAPPAIAYPPWGPPISPNVRRDATNAARSDTAPAPGALVNNKENTSAMAEHDAAEHIPEHPPP
jgi:hypothetical protein